MKKLLSALFISVLAITGCSQQAENLCNKAIPLNSKEFQKIASMGERFKAVVDFVNNNDLTAIQPGTYQLQGDDVYYSCSNSELRAIDSAGFEVHDAYYDIQIPIKINELFGIKSKSACTKPTGPMDHSIDAQLFTDKVEQTILVHPLEAIIFSPEDAHSPGLGEGSQVKIIFKVRKEE